MISRFFINRPVLANVLAILMIVIGAVALWSLPVAQYPNVTPPTVQVQTRYPGADARTIVDTVALPIEQQVNGVENMIYMQSMSTSDGTYTLVVTFAVGTDLNFAQVLVQNRVSAALSQLPDAVQKQGVTVQKQSTAILMFVTLTSPDNTFDSLFLANYGTIRLKDELARLPGVGSVLVFGAGQYSMRIWLDPDKLKARGLTTQDVTQSLQQQSQQVAAGQIGAPPAPADTPFQFTVTVAGRLADVEQFENVIVKAGNAGEITRLRDVGRVELGAQTYGQIFKVNDREAAGIAVFQAPGANALNVEQTVRKRVGRAGARVSKRAHGRDPLQHHAVRRGGDQGGLQDPDRGRPARPRRHPAVPAGLAGDADPGHHGAGDHHRRVRGDGRARLHGEPVDLVRASCSRSASSSTTPSSSSRASPTISSAASPRTTPRSRRWTSCSAPLSASRWC